MHRLSLLLTLLILAAPGMALAHPGHGTTEPTSMMHFVLEPMHAVPLVVLVTLTAAMAVAARRRRLAKARAKKPRDVATSTHG